VPLICHKKNEFIRGSNTLRRDNKRDEISRNLKGGYFVFGRATKTAANVRTCARLIVVGVKRAGTLAGTYSDELRVRVRLREKPLPTCTLKKVFQEAGRLPAKSAGTGRVPGPLANNKILREQGSSKGRALGLHSVQDRLSHSSSNVGDVQVQSTGGQHPGKGRSSEEGFSGAKKTE